MAGLVNLFLMYPTKNFFSGNSYIRKNKSKVNSRETGRILICFSEVIKRIYITLF